MRREPTGQWNGKLHVGSSRRFLIVVRVLERAGRRPARWMNETHAPTSLAPPLIERFQRVDPCSVDSRCSCPSGERGFVRIRDALVSAVIEPRERHRGNPVRCPASVVPRCVPYFPRPPIPSAPTASRSVPHLIARPGYLIAARLPPTRREPSSCWPWCRASPSGRSRPSHGGRVVINLGGACRCQEVCCETLTYGGLMSVA